MALDYKQAALTVTYSTTKMGSTLYSNLSGQTKKFKPFTEDHYRYNLEVLTGISPTRSLHAHHIFPQQYREKFAKIGINIDDPKYLTWWESGAHGRAHTIDKYNGKWQEFIFANPNATAAQILDYGRSMMLEYNLPTFF